MTKSPYTVAPRNWDLPQLQVRHANKRTEARFKFTDSSKIWEGLVKSLEIIACNRVTAGKNAYEGGIGVGFGDVEEREGGRGAGHAGEAMKME